MSPRLPCIVIASGVVLFGACKEKPSEGAAEASQPEAAAAAETRPEVVAQFLPTTNTGGKTIQDQLQGAVHPGLTALLGMFIERHGRMPENFYEFSNRMMDRVPPVPPGTKYEIDRSDRSVKVIKK